MNAHGVPVILGGTLIVEYPPNGGYWYISDSGALPKTAVVPARPDGFMPMATRRLVFDTFPW